MKRKPEDLYLELMKKTLTFTLWPEPPTQIEYPRTPLKRFRYSIIKKILQKKHLMLMREMNFSIEQREDGRIWPGYADTMIGLKRLDNLQFCIETVLHEGIEGDLIETGVWRGGACIFMRAVLAAYGIENRKVFVADSFEGLPKPDIERFPEDKGSTIHTVKILAVSQQEVERNFTKYGLLDENVIFLKGWFKDTLPGASIQNLAILRLDGDMYGSTMDVLNSLYSKLSPGGFCIIDDYSLPRCKKAVDDFRREKKIISETKKIDWTGLYWRKE